MGGGGGEGSLVAPFDLVNSMIQSFDLDDLLIENECSNNRATFISDEPVELLMLIREPFKNYLADFSAKGVTLKLRADFQALNVAPLPRMPPILVPGKAA